MSSPNFRFAKLVGTSDATHWSQAHLFTPPKDKLPLRGQLLVVVSFVNPPPDQPLLEFGREILLRLNEEYYGQPQLSPSAQLRASLIKVGQEFTQGNQQLAITAAVLWSPHQAKRLPPPQAGLPIPPQRGDLLPTQGDLERGRQRAERESEGGNPSWVSPSEFENSQTAIYLGTWGRGEAWICRHTHFGRLLAGEPQQATTISGWLAPSDWYILATPKLFSLVPIGTWRAAINTGHPEEAANLLAPLIHARENGHATAALILHINSHQDSLPVQSVAHPHPSIPPPLALISPLSAFAARLSGLTGQISSFLPRLPWQKQVYIHTQTALKSKKTALTVALLLLLLLGASIFFGAKKRQLDVYRSSYLPQLETAEVSLAQGQSLATTSPDQSREFLWQARQIVSELEARGIKDNRLITLKSQLSQVLGAVLGEYHVEGQLWHDLSLTRNDLQINDTFQAGSTVWLLQHQPVRLIKLDLDKKEVTILAGDKQLGQASHVSGTPQTAYILSDKGILTFSADTATLTLPFSELALTSPDSLLTANYGGNYYLLDKSTHQIWRFPAVSPGKLASKERWLAPGITPDFSQAKDIAIDGSLWILYRSGNLEKYLHGAPQTTALTTLDKPLSQPQDLYTDAQTQSVYLLDSGNSRIVVLDKDGRYQAQYLYDKLAQTQAIFVQEAKKQLFCLIGTQIYLIPLK